MKRRMRPKKTPRKAGMTTPQVSSQTSSVFPRLVEFVVVVGDVDVDVEFVEFVRVAILVSSAPTGESSV